MKTKIFTTLTALFLLFSASGQKAEIDLSMTAIDNVSYIALDSIKVMNMTQGGDTLLVWPDTVLSIIFDGVTELENKKNLFRVRPNYPNPVADETTISVYIPKKDNVVLTITDVSGRLVLKSDRVLGKGLHTFRFQPAGAYLYFFTAQWRGNTQSIKILQVDTHFNGTCVLDYIGSEPSSSLQLKYTEDIQSFEFNPGDELLVIGYTNDLQSGMLEKPNTNRTCTFQFATNIPCPGTPTVDYEGQVYNTIQVFGQCWLKENLNVGTMISGSMNQSDNETLEKYCYGNDINNCNTFGGLYQWNEMMQYTNQQATQGICPQGWHLPTDEEWKVLEGTADSQYKIGDPKWDWAQNRGFDAGKNLKTTTWNGTDLFGFSALPSGSYKYNYNIFDDIGAVGNWWASSVEGDWAVWDRTIYWSSSGISRPWSNAIGHMFHSKADALSVRCLKDY